MNSSGDLKKELKKYIKPEKAAFYPKFFHTGKGEYGEGDEFIGVTVPNQRKVALKFKNLPLSEVKKLLNSRVRIPPSPPVIHAKKITVYFFCIYF